MYAVGEVFGWPVFRTWEFTAAHPIRSTFPLWLIYGLPLTILKWIWEGLGYGQVPPAVAFYVLRLTMFMLSFVLEDWALDELLPIKNQRRIAITLVTSSYVTWTFQAHTLSNSIETLIVLWSIVLIRRIRDDRERTQATACGVLAFLVVLGIFNRVTFPAFLVIPAGQLLPHLFIKPLRLLVLPAVALPILLYAVALDTDYYAHGHMRLRDLPWTFVFTPLNNVMYNLDPANLAQHGLHPFWQHSLANLPQLLGPAFPLLAFWSRHDSLFWSAIVGILALSCFRHQEPRFLLPAVPLLLASLKPPKRLTRVWLGCWIAFNLLAGLLFGTFHQGGVVPAQAWIATHRANVTTVLWWKTYSPPRWLLDGRNADAATVDLMGMPSARLLEELHDAAACRSSPESTLLVAPASATFLDELTGPSRADDTPVDLQELWRYANHIGLDDLDFGDDGVWPTLQRVVGRRGLVIWGVTKEC